jgi:hypothetical protein
MLMKLMAGANFTNVLHTDLKNVYHKSAKISQVISHFALLGSTPVKAACKHVGEIKPCGQFYQQLLKPVSRMALLSRFPV